MRGPFLKFHQLHLVQKCQINRTIEIIVFKFLSSKIEHSDSILKRYILLNGELHYV